MKAYHLGRVGDLDPMLYLALGVVQQAVKDARAGRPDARQWLESDAGGVLAVFNVDLRRVQAALNRPTKRRKSEKTS